MSFLNRIPNNFYIFGTISTLCGINIFQMYEINKIKKENNLLYKSLYSVIDNNRTINYDIMRIYYKNMV